MASNNHRASADNTNAPQDTIVNGDNKEESDHLMAPHHTHHTSQQSRTVYASIQQGQTFNDEGNMLQSVANPEQSISRARQVREAKDFPYTRARVASLAIIFFYMVSDQPCLLRKLCTPRTLYRQNRHYAKGRTKMTKKWSKVCLSVGCLLNVPATCECISGMDLLRQFYVLPH